MPGPAILAQHAGTGAQATAYTSPAGGNGTVISSLVFAGTATAGANATAEVRVAKAGAADAASQVLVPAFPVAAGSHLALTEGITLAKTDVVRVTASAGVNVHLYGTEL